MNKVLTFSEWLLKECSMTEEQLWLVSQEYGEDSEDYLDSKRHEYKLYLQRI